MGKTHDYFPLMEVSLYNISNLKNGKTVNNGIEGGHDEATKAFK